MNIFSTEAWRGFRGSPADEAAGAFAFVAIVLIAGAFFGIWGVVYSGIVCVIATLYQVGSMVRQSIRTRRSEVRHV
jgi:hypothetical protein